MAATEHTPLSLLTLMVAVSDGALFMITCAVMSGVRGEGGDEGTGEGGGRGTFVGST